MSVQQLRPLRIGEVLDAAIKIYLRNAGQLFLAVLVVVVPVQVLAALIQISTTSGGSIEGGKLTGVDQGGYVAGQVVVAALTLLTALLASGACFKAVSDAYMGHKATWRESLRFAFGRLGSLLWLGILATVLIIIALIALILPAIYLGVAFAVATPVLLVEDVRGFKALSRSVRLTRGRWWPTLGTLLVAIILIYVVQAVIGFILGLVVGALFSGGSNLVLFLVLAAILGVIGRMITTPFLAACITVLYYDLRVRKEGYDLELLARDLRDRGAGVGSGSGGAAQPAAAATEASPPAGAGGDAERTSPPGSIPPPASGVSTSSPD